MNHLRQFYFLFLILFPILISASALASSRLTISGISSGGFMAKQMAVIYSDRFSGVATVAGGVFYCAQNTFQENIKRYGPRALLNYGVSEHGLEHGLVENPLGPLPTNPLYQAAGICMAHPERAHSSTRNEQQKNIPMNLKFLKSFEKQNLIAPLSHISHQRVFIYHGEDDEVVRPVMTSKMQEFYGRLEVPRSNVKVLKLKGAAHNFPTDRHDGIDCGSENVPYLANCQRDLAGEILQHLLQRPLQRGSPHPDHFHHVHQLQAPASLADYGYLYANNFCLKNPDKCDLHVALHGCKMSDSYDDAFQKLYEAKIQRTNQLTVQDYEMKIRTPQMGTLKFAQNAGYAEYAEPASNRLMVYFPQTQITRDNYPENPKGCWDWYGWTGEYYATNRGVETSWLMEQIQHLRKNPKKMILKKPVL